MLRTGLDSEIVRVQAIDTPQAFPGSDSLRRCQPGPFAPPGPLEDDLIERTGIVVSRALANELAYRPKDPKLFRSTYIPFEEQRERNC